MSDKAYNQIPEDLRDAFEAAVWEGCKAQWQYLVEANEEAIDNLKGAGVTFYDIDIDELKTAYAAGVAAKGITYDPDWVAAVEAAKAAVQ